MSETLIGHYQRHQFMPTACDVVAEGDFKKHYLKRHNLLVNKLALPLPVWRNAKVLEAGCGSGENSLIYALLGAKMTFIEPLELSVRRLQELFAHFGLQESIEKICLETIEAAEVKEKYDIVLAEGFISSLAARREVMRKLFGAVAEDGLLVVSTNDAVGCLIESFRATIAQLYCRKKNIRNIDDQVEAVSAFFQEDFEGIPHSRPYELWAKDVLFYPIEPINNYYDFDQIVEDLAGLSPNYYSSWPSYRPFNDLKWHKHLPDAQAEMAKAVAGYRLRRPSFLLGEVNEELDAIRFALENRESLNRDAVWEIIKATHEELRLGEAGRICCAVKQAAVSAQGKARTLLQEMVEDLTELDPATYRRHTIIRTHWGVPNHYIVLRRNDDTFMRHWQRAAGTGPSR